MAGMSSVSNIENFSPQIMRGVVRQMRELVAQPLESFKVHLNDEDMTNIQAYMKTKWTSSCKAVAIKNILERRQHVT